MVCLLLIGGAFVLEAVEIRVSIAMDESQPYQKELRYYIVKAIADLEDVKIVEPGQGEWFRIQVLVFEMRLENQLEVGYSHRLLDPRGTFLPSFFHPREYRS